MDGPTDALAASMTAPIKFVRRRSTKKTCLIISFFVNEVQNIQLNRGLPHEFDARDIFCILDLFKFDETSRRSA